MTNNNTAHNHIAQMSANCRTLSHQTFELLIETTRKELTINLVIGKTTTQNHQAKRLAEILRFTNTVANDIETHPSKTLTGEKL